MALVSQLFQEQSSGLHYGRLIASTVGAVPFALWFPLQLDTCKVKPLDGAKVVVTSNHLAMFDLKVSYC